MGRPVGWKPYTLSDGAVVPSVTTICSRFKDSGGLLHWAWTEGREGRDYRETRDAAANAGTLAHAMVEADIKRSAWLAPPDADPIAIERAVQAFQNYTAWKATTKLETVASEMRLVSEKHRFGGTLDAVVRVHGRLSLGDWKTSAAIYPEYLIQLAGYALLWSENFPEQPLTGGFHLLLFGKENADFTHRYFTELQDAERQFILLREAYEIDKRLKARTR